MLLWGNLLAHGTTGSSLQEQPELPGNRKRRNFLFREALSVLVRTFSWRLRRLRDQWAVGMRSGDEVS
jgi:hypothetical protein